MQIWPAIDLRGGKCVRLQQGDFGRETVFGEDPPAMARHWVSQGAQCLHLVDLDGAREGRSVNLEAVRGILAAVDVPCRLGGGIRDVRAIRELLKLGLAQVVVGTRAVREPDWFRTRCQQFPGKLALGIDARDGLIATDGWIQNSHFRATELASRFRGEPLATVIYTDIASDGMLQGPNLGALAEMIQAADAPVTASGGISRPSDVARLASMRVEACIIGRALYEGTLSLRDALAAAAPPEAR